jgi:hypothetical protein
MASHLPPQTGTTPAATRRARKTKTAAPEVEDDDAPPPPFTNNAQPEDESRPSTAIQHSAMYGSPVAASPAMPPPPLPHHQTQSQSDSDHDQYQPQAARVFVHTVPRYIENLSESAKSNVKPMIFGGLLGALTLAGLWVLFAFTVVVSARIPVPASIHPYRDRLLHKTVQILGLPDIVPEVLEQRWHAIQHDTFFIDQLPNYNIPTAQYAINKNLATRLRLNENATESLGQQMKEQKEATDELQRILPLTIVVTEHENGDVTIPPLFWKALAQKMASPDSDSAPLWDSFLQSNEQSLETFMYSRFDKHFTNLAQSHKLLTREEALAGIETALQKQHQAVLADVRTEARAVAQETIEKSEIMSFARAHIARLAHHNYLNHMTRTLSEYNYFSVGNGAMIDPHATSKTKLPPTQNFFQRAIRYLNLVNRPPHPPSVAITHWEEAGDCWCSAPVPDGSAAAELTVKLPRKIHPQGYVLEHIPAAATHDIAAAPKNLEFWAQVTNASEATRISGEMRKDRENQHPGELCKGSPPRGETDWVCLGVATYDIHFHDWAQFMPFWTNTEELGVVTDRVTLRVVNNWGADGHTCIYRVRLMGKQVAPMMVV